MGWPGQVMGKESHKHQPWPVMLGGAVGVTNKFLCDRTGTNSFVTGQVVALSLVFPTHTPPPQVPEHLAPWVSLAPPKLPVPVTNSPDTSS